MAIVDLGKEPIITLNENDYIIVRPKDNENIFIIKNINNEIIIVKEDTKK